MLDEDLLEGQRTACDDSWFVEVVKGACEGVCEQEACRGIFRGRNLAAAELLSQFCISLDESIGVE